MATSEEIKAALDAARKAGNAEHVSILEAALGQQAGPIERSLGMGAPQEATAARAVAKEKYFIN